jgi:hypothetical protein
MKKRITKELKALRGNNIDGKNFIALMIMPEENFNELNMHTIKTITNFSPKGAYVSINKPYQKIIETMEENKIKHREIFFIDCITETACDAKNCVFIKSPQSLTNIGIALDKIYKSKEHKFIFLDSIDSLSVYHNADTLIRFVRSIIEKVRENNKIGMMIGVHEGIDKRIVNEISIVCDKIINLAE